MNLAHELTAYDGKSTYLLERIRDGVPVADAPLDNAIRLCTSDEGHVATGASWLLRAWLELGSPTTGAQAQRLSRQLEHIDAPWTAQHICQSVGRLEISDPETARRFGVFLHRWIASERPFARAWAVDGLHRLACIHDEFTAPADAAIAAALEDPAASVRARARRILAES